MNWPQPGEFVPWPFDQVIKAAERCLADWVAYRGGLGATEKMTALAQVKSFISQHGQSRFEPWDSQPDHAVTNRVGYRRDIDGEMYYLIFPEAFKTIVCIGLNHLEAAKYLINARFLEPDVSGSADKVYKLPREGISARLYSIKANILSYDI